VTVEIGPIIDETSALHVDTRLTNRRSTGCPVRASAWRLSASDKYGHGVMGSVEAAGTSCGTGLDFGWASPMSASASRRRMWVIQAMRLVASAALQSWKVTAAARRPRPAVPVLPGAARGLAAVLVARIEPRRKWKRVRRTGRTRSETPANHAARYTGPAVRGLYPSDQSGECA
jgi:hypothetical protein